MKRRVNIESVAGAAVVAIALGAALLALRFPAAKGAVPGPAMFPLLIAGLWAVLGVALLTAGLRGSRPAVEEQAHPCRALALLALTIGYAVLMPALGFIATSALFLTLAFRLLGYRHGWRAGALGLSVAFAVYGLFARVMNVPLPTGWLG